MVIPNSAEGDAFSSWAVVEKEKEESKNVTSILLNGECEVIQRCREVDALGCHYGIFAEGKTNPVRKSKKLYPLLHEYDKLCSAHPTVTFSIEPLCSTAEKKLRQRS